MPIVIEQRNSVLLPAGDCYYTKINTVPSARGSIPQKDLDLRIQTSYRITAAVSELFKLFLKDKTVPYYLVINDAGAVCGHVSPGHPAFSSSTYAEDDDSIVKDWHLTADFAYTLAICWLLEEDDWNCDNRRGAAKIDHDRALIGLLKVTNIVGDDYDGCNAWYAINDENFKNFPFLTMGSFEEMGYGRGIWLGDSLFKYKDKLEKLKDGKYADFIDAVKQATLDFSNLTKPKIHAMLAKHIEDDFTYDGEHALLEAMTDHLWSRVQATKQLEVVLNHQLMEPTEGKSQSSGLSLVSSPMRTELARQFAKAALNSYSGKRHNNENRNPNTSSLESSPTKKMKQSPKAGLSVGSSPLCGQALGLFPSQRTSLTTASDGQARVRRLLF